MDAKTLWRRAHSNVRRLRRECARGCTPSQWRAYMHAIRARCDLESCRAVPAVFSLVALSVR